MDKNKIKKFFDERAYNWDNTIYINPPVINKILDLSKVEEGKSVLDIACGTGVLFNYYLERNVKSIMAIDLSDEMIKIAKEKFDDERLIIECADAYKFYEGTYDCIMIYNAFPHFDDQPKLIEHLCSLLNKKGTLTVAHGMSIEKLKARHTNASEVSRGPISLEDLNNIMSKYGTIIASVSDDSMFCMTLEKE